MKTVEFVYNASPIFVKKLLLNLEALRRNRFRRYGNFVALKKQYTLSYYNLPYSERLKLQEKKVITVLNDVVHHVPFFSFIKKEEPSIKLEKLPVIKKNDLRKNTSSFFHQKKKKRDFWVGHTSGSTGTPLQYYSEKSGVRIKYAILDNYYNLFGCSYGEKRIRISGAKILQPTKDHPPYWIYNKVDNQLQMSAYHLSDTTAKDYLNKILSFQPNYITGHINSIYHLARYAKKKGIQMKSLKAVFMDSEGGMSEQIRLVEKVFDCPVIGDYGTSEVGLIAVLCREKNYHVLDRTVKVEILDEHDQPIEAGEPGRIIVTDLKQTGFPYIRYDTGDWGSVGFVNCPCGWDGSVIKNIEGRCDEMIITPSGKKLTRLSYITKPGLGIKESQIAHVAPDEIIVRIVPDDDFLESSLKNIEKEIHQIIGKEMKYSFDIVASIKRTKNHKFKHVVKEF